VAAKKGQKTPQGYYNLEKMLAELIQLGVNINVCGMCINSRGIVEADLVEGMKVGSMMRLSEWIKENQKSYPFKY
jgi:uncharacterized protein involved in oxidation of intracellular sulfur